MILRFAVISHSFSSVLRIHLDSLFRVVPLPLAPAVSTLFCSWSQTQQWLLSGLSRTLKADPGVPFSCLSTVLCSFPYGMYVIVIASLFLVIDSQLFEGEVLISLLCFWHPAVFDI